MGPGIKVEVCSMIEVRSRLAGGGEWIRSETCHPQHDWCPNYSSALLPTEDGTEVLEFASDGTGKECITSYAWAPWRSDIRSGAE